MKDTKLICPDCGGVKKSPNSKRCSPCANSGKNNPFYNKTHTEEHKQYISDLSPSSRPEIRKKISESLKGYIKTKFHIENLSQSGKIYFETHDSPNKGVPHSKETRQLIRQRTLEYYERYRKTDEYKKWLKLQPDYEIYYRKVIEITNQQNIKSLENYSKRNLYHKYELDHIYPISKGFVNKIPTEMIGDIKNLRIITRKENRTKSGKITIIPEHIELWQKEQ